MTTPFADDRPLFLLGCVRSGTTLTRDLLRRVPRLLCPEETHFFRWAEPFRTPHAMRLLLGNASLKAHRGLDGIDPDSFAKLLRRARSKAELQRSYVTAYAAARGVTTPYRWCDKTPQNVYGAALIAQELPKARFVHVVRNPLNVVASMILGRQVAVPDIHGACNYWIEAVSILQTLSAAIPDRVLCVRYEDLVIDPPRTLRRILEFAEIDAPAGLFHRWDAHAERHLWRAALDDVQKRTVRNRCGPAAKRFGYDLAAMMQEQTRPKSPPTRGVQGQAPPPMPC